MTLTIIEAAWTFLAVVGFLAQVWAITDAYGDRKALKHVKAPNGRGRLVKGHIRTARIFCLIHLLFVFAGINALIQPNAPLTTNRIMTVAALMLAAIALVIAGLLDRRDRYILRKHHPERRK